MSEIYRASSPVNYVVQRPSPRRGLPRINPIDEQNEHRKRKRLNNSDMNTNDSKRTQHG